ncbi:MAG: glycogen synthase GlgA [Bacillota bacterium]|nr:MAG: glycogen synthase GlgA [Bacillota bacterium]
MPAVEVVKKRRIMIAASECNPFVATGGLADVIGSLPKALAKNGNFEVSVILPLYYSVNHDVRGKMEYVTNFYVQLSWRRLYCGVFRLIENGVTYYFLDNEYYFKRGGSLYGFYDDGERFAFFSKAILETIGNLDLFPDVLQCNDWQTAASIIYLRTLYNWSVDFRKIKTVFTIHNIEYQGKFGVETLGDLFGFPTNIFATVEFDGCINLMKGAIELADAVNTVSPTYAEEIKTPFFAHGLDGIIRRNEQKIYGILNGIDVDGYNPETDKTLFANYSVNDLSGKAVCKAELQKLLGLPVRADVPVVAVISRLVSHKGLDLVTAVIEQFLTEDVQLVVLGKGDASYESYFSAISRHYQGKCSAVIAFNPDLSRKIYSGSDIFLMPSKAEPCGLSQMIASRYGTVAVVRETGGLNDSIKAYTGETGNGFTFREYNAHDMLYVLREAVRTYRTPAWEDVRARAMKSDFSWNVSAAEYEKLYLKIIG